MKTRGSPYSLSRRANVDGSHVFIARFRQGDGTFGPAKSTGVLDRGRPRDRDAAVSWCEKYLAGGQVTTKANTTLATFGDGFFAMTADYARDRLLRGKRYSAEQAYTHDLGFKNWIKDDPLGERRIETIVDQDVAEWQLRLASKGLAPATVRQRTMTLRILLKAAYKKGMLRRPISYEPINAKRRTVRGVLSLEEAARVFASPWPDPRALVGNLLAAFTGLRVGEITGLRMSRLALDHAQVVGTWRPKSAMVSDNTKGEKPRVAPIPPELGPFLRALLAANPWAGRVADPFVFWSVAHDDRAQDPRELTEALQERVDAVLGAGTARARKIGMHGWRVFANTYFVDKAVPSTMIRSVIGHTSENMTLVYYRAKALEPIRDAQAEIAAGLGLPAPTDPEQSEGGLAG